MESILQEKRISFKEFEKKIYQFVCGLGQEIARTMLENYDDHLAKTRDRREYRDKGKRTTTVKTLFGEVTYERRVYQTKTEEGERAYIPSRFGNADGKDRSHFYKFSRTDPADSNGSTIPKHS